MQIDRLLPGYYCSDSSLTVFEMAEDGCVKLELHLRTGDLLLQYKSNIQFVFKNLKRAGGIVFFEAVTRSWNMLFVERKRKVNDGQKWQDIKSQWHDAWLHGIALAAMLGIQLAGRVDVLLDYLHHHMGYQLPNFVLLKQNIHQANRAQMECLVRKVNLPALGEVVLHHKQLVAATSTGQYTLA